VFVAIIEQDSRLVRKNRSTFFYTAQPSPLYIFSYFSSSINFLFLLPFQIFSHPFENLFCFFAQLQASLSFTTFLCKLADSLFFYFPFPFFSQILVLFLKVDFSRKQAYKICIFLRGLL